jgi:hypothetical protein
MCGKPLTRRDTNGEIFAQVNKSKFIILPFLVHSIQIYHMSCCLIFLIRELGVARTMGLLFIEVGM